MKYSLAVSHFELFCLIKFVNQNARYFPKVHLECYLLRPTAFLYSKRFKYLTVGITFKYNNIFARIRVDCICKCMYYDIIYLCMYVCTKKYIRNKIFIFKTIRLCQLEFVSHVNSLLFHSQSI